MAKSILQDKAYDFALRVVRLSEYLNNEKKEYVLARKVLDSGTNVARFIEEANQSPDHGDFVSRLSLSNKEAFKTNLWLRVLRDVEYVKSDHAASMLADCEELQKMLVSSLKTARSRE